MTVAQNSFVIRMITSLLRWVVCLWHGSVLGRAERTVFRWASGSTVCRVLARDGAVLRSWPESLSCRVITWVVNIPCAIAKWIYNKFPGLWEGSVFFRLVRCIGANVWLTVGALMCVMLCAPHGMWNNSYALLAMLLITALFFVGCMSRRGLGLQVRELGPYMVLYIGLIGYGLLASFSTTLSMRFFLFHLTCFLIVLLLVSGVRSYRQIHWMVVLMAAGLLVAALYGCYQGYIGVEVVKSQQDVLLNADMPGRVYSLFDNPNNFAEILVMMVPLVLGLLINAPTFGGKITALGVIGCSVLAIGYTYSRSGWIGLVGAVVLFFAFLNWRLVPVIAVVGIAAIPFLPASIYNRILTIGNLNDTSTAYRFHIYRSTANLLGDYGLRGVGLGHEIMKKVFELYEPLYDGNFPIHTHNNYLQMWGEVGLFGLLAYLATVFGRLKSGVKAYVQSTDRRLKIMLAAAISAMCGILVISIAEYTWFYPRNMFLFWFLFAVIACCVKIARHPEESK